MTCEIKTIRRWEINNDNPYTHDCKQSYWGHACNVDTDSYFEINDGHPDENGSY